MLQHITKACLPMIPNKQGEQGELLLSFVVLQKVSFKLQELCKLLKFGDSKQTVFSQDKLTKVESFAKIN